MYTKPVCVTTFGPLGEIGTNFPVQLSLRSHFANIKNIKGIAESQCEKLEFKSYLFTDTLVYTIIAHWSGPPSTYVDFSQDRQRQTGPC